MGGGPERRGPITAKAMHAQTEAITADSLAELLELASRALHSLGYAEELYPAQWTALRYFARAPEGKRTASELARFQGLANGPVSRTVRTLLHKQLVRKSEPQPIGRAEHLEITAKGAAVLERDPLRTVMEGIGALGGSERAMLADTLESVIRAASSAWPRNGRHQ